MKELPYLDTELNHLKIFWINIIFHLNAMNPNKYKIIRLPFTGYLAMEFVIFTRPANAHNTYTGVGSTNHVFFNLIIRWNASRTFIGCWYCIVRAFSQVISGLQHWFQFWCAHHRHILCIIPKWIGLAVIETKTFTLIYSNDTQCTRNITTF